MLQRRSLASSRRRFIPAGASRCTQVRRDSNLARGRVRLADAIAVDNLAAFRQGRRPQDRQWHGLGEVDGRFAHAAAVEQPLNLLPWSAQTNRRDKRASHPGATSIGRTRQKGAAIKSPEDSRCMSDGWLDRLVRFFSPPCWWERLRADVTSSRGAGTAVEPEGGTVARSSPTAMTGQVNGGRGPGLAAAGEDVGAARTALRVQSVVPVAAKAAAMAGRPAQAEQAKQPENHPAVVETEVALPVAKAVEVGQVAELARARRASADQVKRARAAGLVKAKGRAARADRPTRAPRRRRFVRGPGSVGGAACCTTRSSSSPTRLTPSP
jgi:hypothetical protein